MRKKILTLFILGVFGLLQFIQPQSVSADISSCNDVIDTELRTFSWSEPNFPNPIWENATIQPVNLNFSGLVSNSEYTFSCQRRTCRIFDQWCNWNNPAYVTRLTTNLNGTASLSLNTSVCWENGGDDHRLVLETSEGTQCEVHQYRVQELNDLGLSCGNWELTNPDQIAEDGSSLNGCYEPGDQIEWRIQILRGSTPAVGEIFYTLAPNVVGGENTSGFNTLPVARRVTTDSQGYISGTDTILPNAIGNVTYTIADESARPVAGCEGITSARISAQCTEEDREVDPEDPGLNRFSICGQLPSDTAAFAACDACRLNNGIWTAVGCVSSDPAQTIGVLVRIGISIGGGVALILILSAGFMFTTSKGDPNKTKEAKDLMQSAIIGLLFIIFSVTILQFIGVTILHIPGFGDQ